MARPRRWAFRASCGLGFTFRHGEPVEIWQSTVDDYVAAMEGPIGVALSFDNTMDMPPPLLF